MTRRLLAAAALLLGALLLATPVQAQTNGPFILTTDTGPAACTPGYPVANKGSVGIQINGAGTWTAEFQGSIDGVNYRAITATDTTDTSPSLVSESSSAGQFIGNVGGLVSFKVCLTSYASGQPAVWIGTSDSGGAAGGGGGGGGGGNVVATDLEDGAGDSVGDDATDSLRVNVVAGSINLLDGAGDSIGDDTNDAIRVNVVAGTTAGAQDDDDASIAAGQSGVGLSLALGQIYNGAAWVRQTGDATNGLDVDVTRVSGTVAVQSNGGDLALQSAVDGVEGLLTTIDADTGSILTAVQLIDNLVLADDDDFVDDTTPGALSFGVYQSSPQSITDGDVGPMLLDENGRVQVGGNITVDNSSFNVVTTSAIGFGATAAAVPAGAVYLGANVGGNLVGVNAATEGSITGLYTLLLNPATNTAVVYNSDPCQTGTKVFLPFQGTADAELITGTASNRTYICHIHLTVAGDMDVALISGTGSVCATSTGAIFGGTAAASGWQFVDSRGISIGDGGSAVGKTDTDADNVCIDVSAATQFSGVIVYVVAAA